MLSKKFCVRPKQNCFYQSMGLICLAKQQIKKTLKGVLLRGEKAALGDEEAVGCDAEAGVVVEAAPAAALVVPQPDLLLELLVIPLDQPTCLRDMDQVLERGARRQGGQPVLGGLLGTFGPLDQQPLLRPGRRA